MDVLKALIETPDGLEKDVHMPRFGVNFTIKALDSHTVEKIQNRATRIDRKGAKVVDENMFGILVIVEGCLVPNWSDKQLLEKYGTHDGVEVVKGRLLAGEIAKLSTEILNLSGFGTDDVEEEIQELKN